MALQDPDSLAIDGLSVLGDKPPLPPLKQAKLEDGIHLRWSPGKGRSFPAKGGYYLFRRRTDGPVCVGPKFKSKSVAELQALASISTDIGTLASVDGKPFSVSTSGSAVRGIRFDARRSLRFDLPASINTRSVSVRVRSEGGGFSQRFQGAPSQVPAPVMATDSLSFQPLDERGMQRPSASIVPGDPSENAGVALLCESRVEIKPITPCAFCGLILGKGGAKVEAFGEDGALLGAVNYAPAEWGEKLILPALNAEGQRSRINKVIVTGKGIRIYGGNFEWMTETNISFLGVGEKVIASRRLAGTQQSELLAVVESKDDIRAVKISGGPSELLDLCYVPQVATAKVDGLAKVPGRSWETVPGFTYPLTLPIRHPAYPANFGEESIETSRIIAKSRLRYGPWADNFQANPPQPGLGTVTLAPGSPIVTGSNTQWTSAIHGCLLCVPKGATDFAAYVVMTVLGPDRLILSRVFSGPLQTSIPYQIIPKTETPDPLADDFAELHDQVACLLNSPSDMRAATAPPALDQGIVGKGKFISTFGTSTTVQGIGTQWTKLLEGAHIEIGPKWYQRPLSSYYTDEVTIFRIVSVDVANQVITLDGTFPGLLQCKADFRILAKSSKDMDGAPSLQLKPMQMIELASLRPSHAQVLGLYWVDSQVERNATYDYIVISDFEDRFNKQAGNGLAWLNGAPDFSGVSIDGALILGIKHSGAAPLAPPSNVNLFHLPTAGSRLSLLRPDVADSDVGISIVEASTLRARPLFVGIWRQFRGTTASSLQPENPALYLDRGAVIPQKQTASDKRPPIPAGWPTDTLHFIDARLDVGWYSYRAHSVDLFGRFSELSAPLAWTNKPSNEAPINGAVHLADRTPPPPPSGVQAWALDDRDPYVVRDPAFTKWRNQFDGAPEWAKWKPGNPYPTTGGPIVGLRVQWRWPWTHRNQGADLKEFRVYFQSKPLNARLGTILSVTPVSTDSKRSEVVLDSPQKDAPPDIYKGARLQVGNRAFPILSSQTGTNVKLVVQNGGPSQAEVPSPSGPATIAIPVPQDSTNAPHPLYKELLDPLNWELSLSSVQENDPRVRFEVEMLDDSVTRTFDDEKNPFTGAVATWNGSAIVLDTIPGGQSLAAVRPGIDVISLTSVNPPGLFVLDIQSTDAVAKKVVPVTSTGLDNTAQYQWRIGPRTVTRTFDDEKNPFTGAVATWNGSAIVLDTIPGGQSLTTVRPGIDVISLASVNPPGFFVLDIQSADAVAKKIVVATSTGLDNTAQYEWRVGPRTAGLQGLKAQWNDAAHQLTLDGSGDVGVIRPGVDMVYIPAVATGTPADLNCFFPIVGVETASRKVMIGEVVKDQLKLMVGKSLVPWKIGRPQKIYEVFLPETPSMLNRSAYKALLIGDSSQNKPALWKASLEQPVAYATVSVSSADKRSEIPDVRPSRNLPGNESRLSGPSTVFLVHRDQPPTPVEYDWGADRLYATRADYHGKSFFTMRWKKPAEKVEYYSAHIYRAMDSSLALTHWNQRATKTAIQLAPPDKASAELKDLLKFLNEAPVNGNPYETSARYEKLTDGDLKWLAGLDLLQDAYTQMTIIPLSLTNPTVQDRLGPNDDPATFKGANSAVCASIDTLDGKSSNRYFYKVMLVSSAQTRGDLGALTPPVYLPRVVPPRSPVITEIRGGDRSVSLQWICSREADLREYRVFRATAREKGDLRWPEMPLTTLAVPPLTGQRPPTIDFTDETKDDVLSHYRIVAIDSFGNASVPSSIASAKRLDLSRPEPPEWGFADWLDLGVNGETAPIQIGTPAPANRRTAVHCGWSTRTKCKTRLERRPVGQVNWTPVSPYELPLRFDETLMRWLTSGLDLNADPSFPNEYRIAAQNLTGEAGKFSAVRTVESLRR